MIICTNKTINCIGGETKFTFNDHFSYNSKTTTTIGHSVIFRKYLLHEGIILENLKFNLLKSLIEFNNNVGNVNDVIIHKCDYTYDEFKIVCAIYNGYRISYNEYNGLFDAGSTTYSLLPLSLTFTEINIIYKIAKLGENVLVTINGTDTRNAQIESYYDDFCGEDSYDHYIFNAELAYKTNDVIPIIFDGSLRDYREEIYGNVKNCDIKNCDLMDDKHSEFYGIDKKGRLVIQHEHHDNIHKILTEINLI